VPEGQPEQPQTLFRNISYHGIRARVRIRLARKRIATASTQARQRLLCWLGKRVRILAISSATHIGETRRAIARSRGGRRQSRASAPADSDEMLCCSRDSLESWWVDNEISTAFAEEQRMMKEQGGKCWP